MNIIEIQDISKCFGKQTVLNHVTASFEKGKIYGIIGRNGSGKTVLLECICGIMHQDAGSILVDGHSIGKEKDMAEDVGVIIETPGFLPNYSGFRNLQYLMGMKGKPDHSAIVNAMKTVGLDPGEKKKVGKYSLGMRQRLGIAQAIMESPSILLLDEPMNGLDNEGVQDMRDVFLKLREEGGVTILLASHNKDDIEILCDEVYQIDKGVLTKVIS